MVVAARRAETGRSSTANGAQNLQRMSYAVAMSDCSRYVTVHHPPAAIGANSISAAVDATNYVLWEVGQPLHAFDLDKLAGGRIVVRRARKGERLVLLDGVEYELAPADVVVADEERAVSLAGIMGGLDTAVTADTKNVLLESASFDPVSIRRTARATGLRRNAVYRMWLALKQGVAR